MEQDTTYRPDESVKTRIDRPKTIVIREYVTWSDDEKKQKGITKGGEWLLEFIQCNQKEFD